MQIKSGFVAAILGIGLAAAQTGRLGDAPITTDNPTGPQYCVGFNETSNTALSGYFIASAGDWTGKGVFLAGFFGNLPQGGGPFSYHIHEHPISAPGNCASAGGRLDPYVRGEQPVCDSTKPQTCQVGDLSGKWGAITTLSSRGTFTADYTDLYLSIKPGTVAFLGNRSLVLESADGARIGCGNFHLNTAQTPCLSG